jgi:DNA replication and repair protein RecF
MHIRTLSLTNFRNYARLELDLPERPLLLYGANAQGKTSLLEAIYMLATGSSPLTAFDRELIKWEAEAEGLPYARVRGEVARHKGVHEIEIVLQQQKQPDGTLRVQKTIRVGRLRKRRAELAGRLNVVLFMPQDVELVSGPPARRRSYLDETLSQVNGAYASALERYNDALRQRNAVLRHLSEAGGDPSQLAPFEDVLARDGVFIARWRRDLSRALSQRADRIQQQLTDGAEWLRLDYLPSFNPGAPLALDYQMAFGWPSLQAQPADVGDETLADAFRQALLGRRKDEIERGTTLIGPHRDDLHFVSGSPRQGTHDVDLGTYGSRGQQRTAVLALKLAELGWMRDITGETPVFLLDEVLAELDSTRRRFLLAQVETVEQALLTATDLDMFGQEFRQHAVLWEVRGGLVRTDGC